MEVKRTNSKGVQTFVDNLIFFFDEANGFGRKHRFTVFWLRFLHHFTLTQVDLKVQHKKDFIVDAELVGNYYLPFCKRGNIAVNLQNVMERCASFICEHLLVIEKAIQLRTQFLSVGCSSAVEKVDRSIEKNFTLVSHNDSFLELSLEDLTELLSKDRLNVVSEKEVFSAAMRWTEYSSDRTDFIGR
ncbi:BTB And Kelch [Ancylostoma caninum]|uniref:BTB And Kelch n=1 Tax=Ancylostoma caninum TaxID=29170 RepID=A0A368G426_ANCCA|nr:BTB And Kelch [Ancylostoma caninum]